MQREGESEESKTRSRLANWGSVITTTINDDCPGMMRGDNSLWTSYVSAHLVSGALTALVPDCLFKDLCISISLGRECLPPEQREGLLIVEKKIEQAWLLPIIKGLGSGVQNPPQATQFIVCRCLLALIASSRGLRETAQ